MKRDLFYTYESFSKKIIELIGKGVHFICDIDYDCDLDCEFFVLEWCE